MPWWLTILKLIATILPDIIPIFSAEKKLAAKAFQQHLKEFKQ